VNFSFNSSFFFFSFGFFPKILFFSPFFEIDGCLETESPVFLEYESAFSPLSIMVPFFPSEVPFLNSFETVFRGRGSLYSQEALALTLWLDSEAEGFLHSPGHIPNGRGFLDACVCSSGSLVRSIDAGVRTAVGPELPPIHSLFSRPEGPLFSFRELLTAAFSHSFAVVPGPLQNKGDS